MDQSKANDREPIKKAKLSRRDWILLPLLSVLTIGIIAGAIETIAEQKFSNPKTSMGTCFVMDDPKTGVRGIPNSVCSHKVPETEPTEYRFNSSGYRADTEFGPKAPGTYRIVLTGSSVALGEQMQREKTFAALLPEELSQQTGHKVELYNEGMHFGSPHSVALRFNGVLSVSPDLILWVLTPWDIEYSSLASPTGVFIGAGTEHWSPLKLPASIPHSSKIANAVNSMANAGRSTWREGATNTFLRHYLYESQSLYVTAFLKEADNESGFLKVEPSAEWRSRLTEFDSYAADIEGRARSAGVPLVVTLVPNRAQAAMISTGHWPAGYDPYKLGEELRLVIESHGGTYIDILSAYRNIPNAEQNYLPMDGHPTAEGHEIISDLLAKGLTGGAVPALGVAAQTPVAEKQGK